MPTRSITPERGQEYPLPGEPEAIAKINDMIRQQMIHDYSPAVRPVRRDQHPKAHGCVRAEFVVRADLPAQLQHGIFKQPRTYNAWLRFSSSSSQIQPDTKNMPMALPLSCWVSP